MEENGQQGSAVVLPSDSTHWESVLQQRVDEGTQPFAAVKPQHQRWFAEDMQHLDEVEREALRQIAEVKRETMPAFQRAKVQDIGDQAVDRLALQEERRLARHMAEHALLVARVPKPPTPSDADRADYRYVLSVLQGLPLDLGGGQTVPTDVHDPGHALVLFRQALSDGDADVITALLYGPLKQRRLRMLTADDHRRAQALLGLAAHPDLQREIDGYAAMIQRYQQRYDRIKRRLQGEGWSPGDPVAEMAKGGAA
jgi:hypothetical protein